MGINEVSGYGGTSIHRSVPKKVQYEKPADALRKDSVELSDEARAKFLAEQAKRMEQIQQRIAEGFYARRDVMERVVDALLKELL